MKGRDAEACSVEEVVLDVNHSVTSVRKRKNHAERDGIATKLC